MGASAGGFTQIAGGALTIAGGLEQADAIERDAALQAGQAKFNSELLKIQKEDVQRKAQEDKRLRSIQAKRMIADQKVSFIGQGVDLSSDVVDQLRSDEINFLREDIEAIQNNAWRQSFGLETQATQLELQADAIRQQGAAAARTTLLTSFGSALGSVGRGVTSRGFQSQFRTDFDRKNLGLS